MALAYRKPARQPASAGCQFDRSRPVRRHGPVGVALFSGEAVGQRSRRQTDVPDDWTGHTYAVTLQNGVDSDDPLHRLLATTPSSAVDIHCHHHRRAGHHHAQRAGQRRMVCGRPDGRDDATLNGYAAEFKAAGIDISASATRKTDMWKKVRTVVRK